MHPCECNMQSLAMHSSEFKTWPVHQSTNGVRSQHHHQRPRWWVGGNDRLSHLWPHRATHMHAQGLEDSSV